MAPWIRGLALGRFRILPKRMSESEQRAWFSSTLEYYQGLDFFRGADLAMPADLDVDLFLEWKGHISRGEKVPGPRHEMTLLSLDKTRAWHFDPEIDETPGTDVLEEVVAGWARISRGHFKPANIRAEWVTPSKVVEVHFDLGGQHHRIPLEMNDDYVGWLDGLIIQAVNESVSLTGFQFYEGPFDEQILLYVMLSAAEAGKIRRDRRVDMSLAPRLWDPRRHWGAEFRWLPQP